MQLKKYSNIRSIEKEWKNLYNNNSILTPFQSYEWNLLLQNKFNHFINWGIRLYRGQAKIEYWTFAKNDNIVIAPILIYKKQKTIYLFGQQDMSDYLSLIYRENLSIDILIECIKWLRIKYSDFSLVLDRINESNILMKNACMQIETREAIEKQCVKIEVVENLISKINSDSRRYWKQALKRLDSENHIINYLFTKTTINSAKLAFLQYHYTIRRNNKFDISRMRRGINKVYQQIHRITGNSNDMVSLFFQNNNNTFLAECKIGQNVAAYMICIQKEDTMYVLRISIDDNFAMFRPGILLIIDTVGYVHDNFPSVKFLDFSRGNESYKLNYGGIIHHNYCFTFDSIS